MFTISLVSLCEPPMIIILVEQLLTLKYVQSWHKTETISFTQGKELLSFENVKMSAYSFKIEKQQLIFKIFLYIIIYLKIWTKNVTERCLENVMTWYHHYIICIINCMLEVISITWLGFKSSLGGHIWPMGRRNNVYKTSQHELRKCYILLMDFFFFELINDWS